jgi:hypothetical protein
MYQAWSFSPCQQHHPNCPTELVLTFLDVLLWCSVFNCCTLYAWLLYKNWSQHGFHIVGAREDKHVPPALQPGIDYINPGEEDQMVSWKCASKSSESQKIFMFDTQLNQHLPTFTVRHMVILIWVVCKFALVRMCYLWGFGSIAEGLDVPRTLDSFDT